MEPSQTSKRAACTIIARNYLAQARVLADSYLEHEPDGRFFLLIVDGVPDGVQLSPSITVLGPNDLGIPDFTEMAFKYEITELCTAVKATLMARILHTSDVEQLVYFDPDIAIFRPLDEMWALLEQSNIVLIPHLLDPIPLDGKRPSEQEILIAGAYNLGFIGLRASAETTRMLDWWQERLRDLCRIDVPHGLFVDQKWIDLVPSMFRETTILRDDTYDVAYWNLHSRKLELHGENVLISGRQIAFFHFSGFDPQQPRSLSKHQTRLTVGDGTPIAFLLDFYAQAVQRHGFGLTRSWPYGYARFDNGIAISGLQRRLYASLDAEQRRALGNPFKAGSPASFFQWACRPTSNAEGLSRFLEHLLDESVEARAAFPEARGRQQKAFLDWARTHGVERFGYDPRLADPSAWPTLTATASIAGSNGTARGTDGVNVFGYLTNETGIGAVARGYVRSLQAMGVPLGLRDLAELSPNRSQDTTLADIGGGTPYRINLVCVNADQHFVVKSHVGAAAFRDHYNIGVWFWELPSFPDAWADRFQDYDEIWAPSSFIANTLAAVSPIPIVRVPAVLATVHPGSREAGRDHLGVGPQTFVYLFIFDFASYFVRKNPLATIEAFKQAFTPDDDVRLVIKCVNEHLDPESFASLHSLAGEYPVTVHTGYWSAAEMRDLMMACDAYVSLHRSEGLGLTIADAMALGIPVIATDWSGNTDFMTLGNSFPVTYELVEIAEDTGPYRAGSIWAEPSIDEAARLMRLVRNDPTLARSRGRAAQRDLEASYSVQAVGEVLQRRLGMALAKQRQTEPADAMAGLDARESVPARSVPNVPPMALADSSHGRAGVLMKRGMNFLLRYHTHYQGEINLAFAAFMRQLAAMQDAQAAEIRTLAPQAHVSALDAELKKVTGMLSTAIGELSRVSTDLSRATLELSRHENYFNARVYMGIDAYGSGGDLNEPMGYGAVGDQSAVTSDFSDLFRGTEEFIGDRQRAYLRFFTGASNVVDLGAGRGEFLEVLRAQGIDAVGVDLDAAMVERCAKRGLRAVLADAYDYLEGLAENSVDVIFSAQFIEHVPSDRLLELLELSRSRLRERGLFIAETVNPESHLAMKTFFVDLSHQRPIFPQVLLQLCQAAGYHSARIFYPTGGGFTQAQYRDTGEYAVVAVK